MASLGGMGAFGAAAGGRGAALAATKSAGAGGSGEEKGLFEWLLGLLQKDQLLETDPVLNKVEGKGGSGTTSRGKGTTSVAVPNKSGGFGGLFAKK